MTKSQGWWTYAKYLIGFSSILLLVKYNWVDGDGVVTSKSRQSHNCSGKNLNLDCFNAAGAMVQQDDPNLVRLVRTLLRPPSNKPIALPPFNPANYFDRPSTIVSKVENILTSLSPGFFIECGALDGLMASNTIWLERKFGWTGLLIEANQEDYYFMVKRRRHAWLSNFCLSLLPYPNKVNFYLGPEDGLPGVASLVQRDQYNVTIPVVTQCMPLYTLLLAMNRTTIDYFSLDVEGVEPKILETIPFDKVIFKVFNLENGNPGGSEVLQKILLKNDYIFYKYSPSDVERWDSIFLHSSMKKFIENSTSQMAEPNKS